MVDTLAFELVTPTKLLVSEDAELVTVPGGDGDFGAMAHHAPLLSTIRPGVIEVSLGGKVTRRLFIAGGFAEVTGERLTVLAEEAIAVGDITPELVATRRQAAADALQAAATPTAKRLAEHTVAVAEALAGAVSA